MKFTSAILLLSPLLASALSFPSSSDRKVLDDQHKVPGSQPLTFCKDPADYILDVHNVDLIPNPPVPGEKLIIRGNGTFNQEIEDGASVYLQVKYGLITLIKQDADMCEQLPKIDIECPIKKGYMEIYKEVNIPRQVPPGKYTVLADVKTKDKEPITCMEAVVVFPR
ncbi:Phosphatidylglycerol/phosphatidylinositol transfer protein [Lithohypha guttulata]|uniref:Phosphatidylglycerol/phosphatidylinositol transfer protein n=1 Tax=Lithohypha guttulata TaxID=1690604 RepID=A0AAN7Y4F7_9EURO|nr:Phosphatidylglycerol/phosphatidylinositol transfer protein [Lithohypha guttulata]KAK5082373.1 Phosphatidylglycerol/phosphatidylinositol transfer protein [Lithohypha guttulata]KAK5105193.1 Phosphatidylglycerol/phosphatidylinositol transfer protein [Lithohypha guttulata]